MIRENFNDLYAFVIVAQEKSFTKAAAKIGVSQSALSQTIRALESRLDIRLLSRTTRSVSATDAGEKLLHSLQHHFSDIEREVSEVTALRECPAGNIRLTAGEHAMESVLLAKLLDFAKQYPDINVEVHIDNTMVDLVENRFDAGVRMGNQVEKDMIAVRIGPELRMTVVGSPEYFAKQEKPIHPNDLVNHSCLNYRLPTYGGHLIWDFSKEGEIINVRPQGQLTFNTGQPILQSALAGLGLAYLTEDVTEEHINSGKLIRVLDDWCEPFQGYHLYYPSRRQPLQAFKLLVDALRYKKI